MDRQITRLRNGLQLDGRDETLGEDITILLKDANGDVLLASGLVVPSPVTGYAVGSIFLHTDGGIGDTLYTNEGSNTTCDFNVSAGGATTTFSALTDTTIAAPADGHLPIYDNATSKWINKVISGDITLDELGAVAIASDVIIDDDIKSDAAIAFSKLAVSTDINTSGEVVDLTISGETNGDVLIFSGGVWTRQPATSLPAGTASVLAQSTTIETGADDITLSSTTQTGAVTLTIPDFGGVSDVFVFETLAQTLVNKTLTSPILTTPQINDTSATHQYIFGVSELSANRTVTLPLLAGNDTFVFEAFQATLTNKILSDDSVYFGDSGDVTKKLEFELSGATASRAMTLLSSHTDNRTLTLPDATDTLVGKATTDVFTNKSIDADNNPITNINGDELDPSAGTSAAYGIPIVIPIVNGGSVDVNVFGGNVPFKFRIIDAWAINTQVGNAGNWKLTDGTDDITETVGYGANDNALTRCDAIIDAKHDITGKPLHLISSNGADIAIVYVSVIRVD